MQPYGGGRIVSADVTEHLIGSEEEELVKALKHAFRDQDQLESLLRNRLGFEIDDVISRKASYQTVIERVVREFDSHGRVDELVATARDAREGNEKLRDFARRRSKEQVLDEAATTHARLALSDFGRVLSTAVARSRIDAGRADRELLALRGNLDESRSTLLGLLDAPLREPAATLAQQLALRDQARAVLLLLDALAPLINAALTADEHDDGQRVRSLAMTADAVARRLRSIEDFLSDDQRADR